MRRRLAAQHPSTRLGHDHSREAGRLASHLSTSERGDGEHHQRAVPILSDIGESETSISGHGFRTGRVPANTISRPSVSCTAVREAARWLRDRRLDSRLDCPAMPTAGSGVRRANGELVILARHRWALRRLSDCPGFAVPGPPRLIPQTRVSMCGGLESAAAPIHHRFAGDLVSWVCWCCAGRTFESLAGGPRCASALVCQRCRWPVASPLVRGRARAPLRACCCHAARLR